MAEQRLGIKRKTHRREDARASLADAEFSAIRKSVLRSHGWRCAVCGWKSEGEDGPTHLQVHHIDDDHHNNQESNLEPLCPLDHAYHHLGCDAPSHGGHVGWASQMRVAYLPGLSPADLNLLHMALGAALADPSTAPVAQAIYRLLEVSTLVVKDGWGSHKAKDFAAAMERMTPEQYAHRKVDDLRVLYDWPIVQQMGEVWKKDYPMLSARSWAQHKR